MTITKSDITRSVARNTKLNKSFATAIVDSFFEQIKCTLEQGEHVKISGFGTFSVHNKNPRPGRNPKTGVEVEISSRNVVTFKMGNGLRDSMKVME